MGLYGVILIAGVILFAALAVLFAKRAAPAPRALPGADTPMPPPTSMGPPPSQGPPDVAVPFGYKCAWLAIQGVTPEAVTRALGLIQVQPCGWPEGIDAAYEGMCFVTPALDGWVLAVSNRLPDMGDRNHPDRAVPLIGRLSEQLDTVVQYFGTHRVVDYHAWAWAERGRILRAYGYVGDQGIILANEGEPTPGERVLLLDFSVRSFREDDDPDIDYETFEFPDESQVMVVAGAWSLDPTELDRFTEPVGTGLLGKW